MCDFRLPIPAVLESCASSPSPLPPVGGSMPGEAMLRLFSAQSPSPSTMGLVLTLYWDEAFRLWREAADGLVPGWTAKESNWTLQQNEGGRSLYFRYGRTLDDGFKLAGFHFGWMYLLVSNEAAAYAVSRLRTSSADAGLWLNGERVA